MKVMLRYRHPGVYIEEDSFFPRAVRQVATGIPAFIGYTEKGTNRPIRITSMEEFERNFGGAYQNLPTFIIDAESNSVSPESPIPTTATYCLYYQLQMYFANGGDACYIVSAGNFSKSDEPTLSEQLAALSRLKDEDEPKLLVLSDARAVKDSGEYHLLMGRAIDFCSDHGNRFLICDVKPADKIASDRVLGAASIFRKHLVSRNRSYGAAYFPDIKTTLTWSYKEQDISIKHLQDHRISVLRHSAETLAEDPSRGKESLYHAAGGLYRLQYHNIIKVIDTVRLELPPSGAVAGVYAMVDQMRGVWKSPANVALNQVLKPSVPITNYEQRKLNNDAEGKSINAIRQFPGKGALIWGARTLDGNSSEWKYVAVRRSCNMVQETIQNAIKTFVFEANDADTWQNVKNMVANYMHGLWRRGALAGSRPSEAYFVKVGLGETMTQQDINEGRMSVEIGLALIRPAEFIILRFAQKMSES